MNILHTIGDSSAIHAWPSLHLPGWRVETHCLGSPTANAVTYKDNSLNLASLGIETGDAVCFCFGGVDCELARNNTGLASAYLSRLFDLCYELPACGRLIMGPIPPEQELALYRYTSPEAMRAAVIALNADLTQGIRAYGWTFLDALKAYSDESGWMASGLGRHGHIIDAEPLERIVKEALGS